MILTCPECATRYFLDDERFGTGARSVRCASCGASWKASREDAAIDLSTPAGPDAAVAKTAETPEKEKPLPQAFRAKAQARRQTRQAVGAGVVWGGLGAAVAALMIGAVVFRIDVVRLWPRTAGAYAKVGLTVNPVGLSPENVLATPGLQDGHVAVMVNGVVRNVETRPRRPTPLRVTLLDKAGKPLVNTIVRIGSAPIDPGKTAPFNASFVDPPAAAVGVQVEFVFEAPEAPSGRPGSMPPAIKLRGPAQPALPALPAPKPVEALPAASPYALPPESQASGHQAPEPQAPQHQAMGDPPLLRPAQHG